ncbi:MAG: LLM class flavin-dependent oxidoreductase [Rhodospirillaceae bacterium]|nr:LLM class flavin-dependent oxidoreductase [Rhodospirillaceae bacterium]MBT3886038.1 LLM class flavin-dependent oxidoreductase [Rhodospirillaceae bacterium]MBT4116517.1 LLM class flavin-dependent oxidoreductase [Rhodospirillaceae bacterium]MBT4672637.1 LLM class flavin-dependent oxidoreductase [Rhodospirillaceae bacterium]MBT4721290.1 LLM class flavin-dependent oxidoreductase [Rhodospirillaceae bacterium]
MHPLKFGVFDHLDRGAIPLAQYYEARLRLIEMYDRAEFYAYHVAEHHATPLGMAPSPNLFLAAIAQRTKKLRFGPMVYALTLYHPLRLAEEICMLDQMSQGRLELGFGRGASPHEIRIFGSDPDDARELYQESLDIVLAALRNGHLDHKGKFFDMSDVPVALEPMQRPHPPIWYGMHTVASAARAGANGHHVISLDSADQTHDMTAAYNQAYGEAGHKARPNIGIGRFIVVGETDAEALAVARRAYPVWHQSFSYLFTYRGGPGPLHPRPADFDAMAASGRAVAGSPETVAKTMRAELAISGANYLVGQLVFGDMSPGEAENSAALFIEKVMPELASLEN